MPHGCTGLQGNAGYRLSSPSIFMIMRAVDVLGRAERAGSGGNPWLPPFCVKAG
jgi:hypothetical protein